MDRSLSVLIAENSHDDALLLIRELERGGFAPNFSRVETAEDMRFALEKKAWDLVISDHRMPQLSSIQALQVVKDSGLDIPVIIVSGNIGEEIAVEAMRSGAHDYIMKSNIARLGPAIERELREANRRRAHRLAEDRIRYMADHDALTNLVNRHEFELRLKRALASAKARGLSHALLYIDIDQFKIINDTCGHVAGDDLLRQLAFRLLRLVRDNDTLARLGGDEFGALVENCPIDRAMMIAENLRQATEDFRFAWQEKPFSIGVSIGVVALTTASQSVKEVLSAADMACYAAKDKGRNRTQLYRAGDQDLLRRHGEMEWVSRINRALLENRFVLHRQAIVPLGDTRTQGEGFEFLVRLCDEQGNLIPPGAFIPAAERYNLMPALDRRVIELAFTYLAKHYYGGADGRRLESVFINLSGRSLSDPSFFACIRGQLKQYDLPAEKICFEITETAAIANVAQAVDFIKGIRDQGCRFALDDFGSGMCSFSYLKSIPIDYLKIDGSFVRNIMNDRVDCAIVEAITKIGQQSGIRTIAEFVEDEAVTERLTTIGVNYAQGFGIDRPRPVAH